MNFLARTFLHFFEIFFTFFGTGLTNIYLKVIKNKAPPTNVIVDSAFYSAMLIIMILS